VRRIIPIEGMRTVSSTVVRGGLCHENTAVGVRDLATLEHAACLRRRKKSLPELFVPYLPRELSQDLRC
jgi:hypothetical protein